MRTLKIPLNKLVDHPLNDNCMSHTMTQKLKYQIQKTHRYEPIIVREHPEIEGCYEIIHGHQRKRILEQCQVDSAWCIVWILDNHQALCHLATVNRLRGQADLKKRANILEKLLETIDEKVVLKMIPETKKRLHNLLKIGRSPKIERKQGRRSLQPLTFFLEPNQKEKLLMAIKRIGGKNRSERLANLADNALSQ